MYFEIKFCTLKTCLTFTLKKKERKPKPNQNHFYYDNQLQSVSFQIEAKKAKEKILAAQKIQ